MTSQTSWLHLCPENEAFNHIMAKCSCGHMNATFEPTLELVRTIGMPIADSVGATVDIILLHKSWYETKLRRAYYDDIALARLTQELDQLEINPDAFWRTMAI